MGIRGRGDRRQETEDRRRETGDRRQETEDRSRKWEHRRAHIAVVEVLDSPATPRVSLGIHGSSTRSLSTSYPTKAESNRRTCSPWEGSPDGTHTVLLWASQNCMPCTVISGCISPIIVSHEHLCYDIIQEVSGQCGIIVFANLSYAPSQQIRRCSP